MRDICVCEGSLWHWESPLWLYRLQCSLNFVWNGYPSDFLLTSIGKEFDDSVFYANLIVFAAMQRYRCCSSTQCNISPAKFWDSLILEWYKVAYNVWYDSNFLEMLHHTMRIFRIFFEVLQAKKYWYPCFYGYVNKVLGNKYGNSMKQGKLKWTTCVIKDYHITT